MTYKGGSEKQGRTYEDLHVLQHTVRRYELVREMHALWFHGVSEAIREYADIRCGRRVEK